jgi:hypothetical protein
MLGGRVLAAVAIAAALATCAGTAEGAARKSTPLPPDSYFVLAPSDFHSATILGDSTRPDAGHRELYVRVFKPGARIGSKPLLGAVSIALIDADASTAALHYGAFKLAVQSPKQRKAFAQTWAVDFVKGLKLGSKGKATLKVKTVVAGAPAELGDNALRLPLSMKTSRGTMHLSLVVVEVDRVVAIVELLGEPNRTLDAGDSATALTAIRGHLRSAFTIANTVAPTIGGTPTVGQTLTVDEGSWAGAPSSFAYAWSRCDSAGANCQPIAGATTNSYQVSTADGGSTLVVAVIGTNEVGSQSASSAPVSIPSP